MSLSRLGDFTSFLKFCSLSAFGGLTTYFLMNPRTKRTVSPKDVIVTTGCDSGLGYSLAVHCHEKLNMSVVACVLCKESKGALKLRDLFSASKRFHIVELEITKTESIDVVKRFVEKLLQENQELNLATLVNNCGVMTFGELEWQTNELIESQVAVNLLGTMKMTKAFLPLIRNHKSRIINVTSHCGIRPLPGLPIYCATKAGIKAFTETLRLDMKKYEVDVVDFIPGSFVMSSNISAAQSKQASEMKSALNEEQVEFYGDYFDRYYKYLDVISGEKEPQMVSANIIETFEDALLDNPTKSQYLCEPARYKLYHALFKVTPQPLTDFLLHKFMKMPLYDPTKSLTRGSLVDKIH